MLYSLVSLQTSADNEGQWKRKFEVFSTAVAVVFFFFYWIHLIRLNFFLLICFSLLKAYKENAVDLPAAPVLSPTPVLGSASALAPAAVPVVKSPASTSSRKKGRPAAADVPQGGANVDESSSVTPFSASASSPAPAFASEIALEAAAAAAAAQQLEVIFYLSDILFLKIYMNLI